ncbi:MAG TPA: hypothetical protein VET27_13010 [Mycobacterium sp.]|nr:hypothetical protein [Mycobacterium sp.]
MKKILVVGGATFGSVAAAFSLGVGLASADDSVVGQTYEKAKAALSAQGMTAVVATSIGGRKDLNECIVTGAHAAPSLDGFGVQRTGTMLVNINCAGQ